MSSDEERNGVHRGLGRVAEAGMAEEAEGRKRGGRIAAPDPEVRAEGKRRRFTAEYKLRIVKEAEGCGAGEVGALLRREGLYSSHLTQWRRQKAAGVLVGRGKRGGAPEELREALQRLYKEEKENRRLRQRLERAETIIAVQKLSTLLQVSWPEVGI